MASSDFATVEDIVHLKRTLTASEQERAGYLLPIVSDAIRFEARKVGKDADALVAEDTVFASIAKAVTVDVVMRELNTPGTQLPATQYAESAGSVSLSYSLPTTKASTSRGPRWRKSPIRPQASPARRNRSSNTTKNCVTPTSIKSNT